MIHNKGKLLLWLAALVALLAGLVSLATGIIGDSAPVVVAAGHMVSPEGLLNPDGTLDMSTGFQGTLDLRGWEVMLDSQRGPVLKPPSHLMYQVTGWNALPNQGLEWWVYALAVVGSDLYVGGWFTTLGDGTDISDCIARYDTTANTWHALPNQGLDSGVYALAVSGNDLYVGGGFTALSDTTDISDRVARYDTTGGGSWHDLPKNGLNDWVLALAVSGSDLYVGGWFTALGNGDPISHYIARYDTTANTWHALPNQGLDDEVRALAVSGSDLYVGGWFTALGDTTDISDLIARYDTAANTWHALPNQGLGVGKAKAKNPAVSALAVSSSDLYVGGEFTTLGDWTDISDNIARYDMTTGAWNALPNQGLSRGGKGGKSKNPVVSALAVSSSDLYVGGEFTQTVDGTLTDLGYIARGTLWQPPPPVPVGGIVVPVSKLELLALRLHSGRAPWLGLVALASLAALTVALVRRRKA